jgi:monoterpene epsilon-lactone hydrolase
VPSEAHQMIVELLKSSPMFAFEDGAFDVAAARTTMEAMTASSPLPDGTRIEPVDAAGVPAEWLDVPGVDPSRVLLYLHGGGYVIGSIASHRALAARIAAAAGVRALIIDYRLAPEHPFPAAVEDATAAYEFLLGQGIVPSRIAIGGDSAGGGLTFASLVALRDAGRPLPGAAIALSPWTDLAGTGESMTTRAHADPMVQREPLLANGALYLGEADARTPTASPLYADLAGLPPICIQVGTAETLLDDSTRIAERIRAAGGRVELEAFEDLIHVFQAFAPHVPESVEAIEKLGAFVKRSLQRIL